MKKREDFLQNPVEHIDIKRFDARGIITAKSKMSFVARETANAANIYGRMIKDKKCTNILVIAGSATAAGCLHIPIDLVENKMVDVIVVTGAVAVDMDFFEGLGFHHYQGSQFVDDEELRTLMIDRIYDTYIDEEDLRVCDEAIFKIANSLPHEPHSSQQFIAAMGKYLVDNDCPGRSMVKSAYLAGVPIFVPAFSDCSAGFGLSKHQFIQQQKNESFVTIDSVRDFLDLTKIVVKANQDGGTTGLFMIGGGSPKNFAQDTIVNAEMLGYEVGMHKYAIQITVADPREGACSSSTLKEANSWGKVRGEEQMVFAEATTVWPEIASCIYHRRKWYNRENKNYLKFINEGGKLPLPTKSF